MIKAWTTVVFSRWGREYNMDQILTTLTIYQVKLSTAWISYMTMIQFLNSGVFLPLEKFLEETSTKKPLNKHCSLQHGFGCNTVKRWILENAGTNLNHSFGDISFSMPLITTLCILSLQAHWMFLGFFGGSKIQSSVAHTWSEVLKKSSEKYM